MSRLHPKDYECHEEGCTVLAETRDWCRRHYEVHRRAGTFKVNRPAPQKGRPCAAEGCTRGARSKGMCSMHYERVQRRGTTELTLDWTFVDSKPLAKYVGQRDIDDPNLRELFREVRAAGRVSLAALDRICCEGLGVHPGLVYPEEWFDLTLAA